MKTHHTQSGNALVYVLIAIALFASLSFVLGRQTDSSETDVVTEEKINLSAMQIINYSAQVKSVIEQMEFSGAFPEELTFFLPGDTHYSSDATYTHIFKIFHPDGGGLSMKNLPAAVQGENGSEADPAPGWYLGRFNNVEWTDSTAQDIILVAYKITEPVCAAINETITGDSSIPALGGKARSYFIKEAASSPQHIDSTSDGHGGATNVDLTAVACPECEGLPSLCVANNTRDVYAFYSLMAER